MKVTSAVPQLSEAVKVTASATLSHSTVSSAGRASLKVGAVVSCTVIVWVCDVELPHSSVAVQVLVRI